MCRIPRNSGWAIVDRRDTLHICSWARKEREEIFTSLNGACCGPLLASNASKVFSLS